MIRTLPLASLIALLPPAAGAQGVDDATMTAKAAEADRVAAAAEEMRVGPVVGEAAPMVSLVGPDGSVSLADLAGEKGTVVAFFRSADWCPFCQKQLVELEDAAAPLADSGWTLIGVSYDAPETLAAFKAGKGLSYGLYADPGSMAIDAFHLRNHGVTAGSRFDGIPHPAIIFVAADGTVKAVLREDGYKARPSVESVLAMAGAL
ncbi:MAG: peroxiredoxin family protein [Hyphomonas sp.]|uniref:peroxiredoxin family protein n=1 Tax=Hyphomonas sp. TaxID=87 RepID=UPI003529586A